MNEILPLMGGYILTAVFGVLYALSRSAIKNAQAETLAAQNLLEELKEKNKLLNKDSLRLKKDSDERDSRLKQSEKDLLKMKERHEKQIHEFETNLEELKHTIRKADSKTEHFKSQIEALTVQIQEVDSEKRDIRLQLEEVTNTQNEKVNAKVSELKKQVRLSDKKTKDLEQELRKKESKIEKTQEKLKTADPTILKKAKIKLSHYAHLYKLMRGQKEMAEERNQNWELALKLLSTWILDQKGKGSQKDENLGHLVASALEATRSGPLVDDNNGLGFPEEKLREGDDSDGSEPLILPQSDQVATMVADAITEEPYEKAVVVKKNESIQQS